VFFPVCRIHGPHNLREQKGVKSSILGAKGSGTSSDTRNCTGGAKGAAAQSGRKANRVERTCSGWKGGKGPPKTVELLLKVRRRHYRGCSLGGTREDLIKRETLGEGGGEDLIRIAPSWRG